MVNIVAEYRLDYTGNNPPLQPGESYDFAKSVDTIGLGDDGRLYLLYDEIQVPILPSAQSDENTFTYTTINCDADAAGDPVSTSMDLAQADIKNLTMTAAAPAAAEAAIQSAKTINKSWIEMATHSIYDDLGQKTGEWAQHSAGGELDINRDNKDDEAVLTYTSYTLDAEKHRQDQPIESVTYTIRPMGR